MIGKRTEDARPASLPEVKELLEARAVQPDFGYEQQTSLDYSKKFAKIEKAKADKLVAALMEIDGMKIETAVKLADILPSYKSTLPSVFAKDKTPLSDAIAAKVMETLESFRK